MPAGTPEPVRCRSRKHCFLTLYLNRREKELDEYERLLFGEDDATTVEPEEAAAEDETEAE